MAWYQHGLFFGVIPWFPIINTKLPNRKEKMEAVKTAQAEMNAIVAERRFRTALTHEISPAADRSYKVGEEVFVFSENRKEWIGPYLVVGTQGRMVTVQNIDGDRVQMFNTF